MLKSEPPLSSQQINDRRDKRAPQRSQKLSAIFRNHEALGSMLRSEGKGRAARWHLEPPPGWPQGRAPDLVPTR